MENAAKPLLQLVSINLGQHIITIRLQQNNTVAVKKSEKTQSRKIELPIRKPLIFHLFDEGSKKLKKQNFQ